MSAWVMKRNDTLPAITATLYGADGGVADLSGATVKFIMADAASGTSKVNAAGTVVDATAGTVKYQWIAADTNTAGTYNAEWQVTYADATVETFPNTKHLTVVVLADVGS